MAQTNNAALVTNLTPYFKRRGESAKYRVYTTNVSSPPTDAELDSAFGTPAEVGDGWSCFIDDNNLGTTFWHIVSVNGSWVYEQYALAV